MRLRRKKYRETKIVIRCRQPESMTRDFEDVDQDDPCSMCDAHMDAVVVGPDVWLVRVHHDENCLELRPQMGPMN